LSCQQVKNEKTTSVALVGLSVANIKSLTIAHVLWP